jgi:hypothetical protein
MSENSQLWNSSSSESPIGNGHVSILASHRPGSNPEDPMAFVESPAPDSSPVADETYVTEPVVVPTPTQTARGAPRSSRSSSNPTTIKQLRVTTVSREFDL